MMARKLGISVNSLSRYETGVRRIAGPVEIAARCVVLHDGHRRTQR